MKPGLISDGVQGSTINNTTRPVIVGSFGPPTLACIRSWGRQGLLVGMVCIVSKKEPPPDSKYLTDFVTLPSDQLNTPDGIQIIKEFLIRFRATGIMCVAESIACWLNDHRQMFPDEVAVWLPTNETIKNLISKQKQIEIARKVGFNVLPTYLISKDLQTTNGIRLEHFPLCLRPTDPATIKPVFKVHLVYSHEELKKYISSMLEINLPIIAQPFMNLPNLVVHGARTNFGATIGLEGFLVERKFEGVTLTICPTRLENGILDKCIDFTNHFNVTGNYHFEFLIDKKKESIYFLEINNRLGGTTAKVFACGYDEPLLVLQAYGIQVKNHRQVTNVTVSSKQALLKYFYYTLKGRLTPFDYPSEPSLLRIAKTIYGFLRYRDDVFMFRDLKGSLAIYLGNLRNKVQM